MNRLCFLENLTGPALLRLLGCRPGRILVLYRSSWAGKWIAALFHQLGLLPRAEEMSFDFFDDVVVPNERSPLQEVYFHACPALLQKIEEQADYEATINAMARQPSHRDYLRAYLSKRFLWELFAGVRSVLIAQWQARTLSKEMRPYEILLVRERSWLNGFLQGYADSFGVRLLSQGPSPLRWIAPRMAALRYLCARFLYTHYRERGPTSSHAALPRIAVEMYRHGIRRCTVYNTDLFWLGHGPLPPHSVFAYFRHASDQPNAERAEILRSAEVGWMDGGQVLRAMAGGGHPYVEAAQIGSRRSDLRVVKSPLRSYGADFYREYIRWSRFFAATGTKIHVSTSDHFPESEALHAALEDSGGLSVSIQRSIEWDARISRRTVLDVHFGFSRSHVLSEQQSGSRIRQFVVAGYLFDDVFPAAHRFAQGLREGLRKRGVTFALCFLDENEGVNPKTLGGTHATRADYNFLCQRLEEDKTLGLLLKPKRVETLSTRLGPVWKRLEDLIQEGRCILLGGKPPDLRYLPCAAAAAADVAVNILNGGTAGLESYLSGTRTLLLNRGWSTGPFSTLPEGSVVCNGWEQIWSAVDRLRANPQDSTVGNWEPILGNLVSFRDGQSARRMGQYIAWLQEAFRRGMTREEAIEYAGDQYAQAWGKEWVQSIQTPHPEMAS